MLEKEQIKGESYSIIGVLHLAWDQSHSHQASPGVHCKYSPRIVKQHHILELKRNHVNQHVTHLSPISL